jgi:hypothetical protein
MNRAALVCPTAVFGTLFGLYPLPIIGGSLTVIAMTKGDQYRALAAQYERRARATNDPSLQTERNKVATAYYRLADLADLNDKGGLVVDITLPEPPVH